MNECNEQLLSAYIDGECAFEDRDAIELHLRQCSECSRVVAMMRESSGLISAYRFDDMTPAEQLDLHERIEAGIARPVLRFAMTLGLIAASILIVSCAWLMEMPAQTAPTIARSNVPAESWERVAMNLRVDPIFRENPDVAEFADARLAEWMLRSLNERLNRAEN